MHHRTQVFGYTLRMLSNSPKTAIHKVGLVLGGGGARGLAHIGVLRALHEHQLKPVAIAGCSMGAIVGAFYAAGYSPEKMVDILAGLSYLQLLKLGDLGGLIGGAGIEALLAEYLPETFEELDIPLELTAVDVQQGSLVVLRSGKLIPALRASSALPGILSPVHYLERYFVDGGLLNNLPVDVIRTMTLEPIIAVDVSTPPNKRLEFEVDTPGLLERLGSFFKGESKILDNFLKRSLTVELFMKAFDVPQKIISDMRLSLHPPDLLIRPELDTQFGVEDFSRAEEAIDQGYTAASQALTEWLAKASQVAV